MSFSWSPQVWTQTLLHDYFCWTCLYIFTDLGMCGELSCATLWVACENYVMKLHKAIGSATRGYNAHIHIQIFSPYLRESQEWPQGPSKSRNSGESWKIPISDTYRTSSQSSPLRNQLSQRAGKERVNIIYRLHTWKTEAGQYETYLVPRQAWCWFCHHDSHLQCKSWLLVVSLLPATIHSFVQRFTN